MTEPHAKALALSLGASLFLFGAWYLFSSYDGGDILGLLIGVGILVPASRLLAPLLSERIGNRLVGLLYSGDHLAKPAPLYSVPEAFRARGELREALSAYRALLQEHPQELPAWQAALEIASLELREPATAETLLREAAHTLQNHQQREELQATWRRISARLLQPHDPLQEVLEIPPELRPPP